MKKVLSILVVMALLVACGEDGGNPTQEVDNFDREAMLVNWADNIIVPAYEYYVAQVGELNAAMTDFKSEPNMSSLEDLRGAWLDAYLAFQEVSIFEIGPAESLGFRNFTNIYPTNSTEIDDYVASGEYNLELPSTMDAQGFPALDYLLYGVAESDGEILTALQAQNHMAYLEALVTRLNDLGTNVLKEWQNSYRDTFVSNSGSTATSSVNKMTNDFMFYYEKALRAGKIGIPAGVFSGTPLSDRVEGLYSRQFSKLLFITALDATIEFFEGEHFESETKGESFATYLRYFDTGDGENLADNILAQFETVESTAASLNEDFFNQVETANADMLEIYDQLQENVILMKVDMFQRLNIGIDYVDADGD